MSEIGSNPGELRRTFHEALADIEAKVVAMAAHVTEAIPMGTNALLDNDLAAAQELIDHDDVVDTMSLALEEECYQVLALQQPMAGDLRAITTALWMNSEIERSGDLMVNIAKGTRRIYGTKFDARLRGIIVQMSEEASRLFRMAIDAYAERNAGLASALDDIDDRLDELNYESVKAIFAAHNAGEIDLQAAVQLALISRFYERIGDHAVNIGERVRYMVDGWHPEHTAAGRDIVRRNLAARAVEETDEAVDEG